MHLFLSQFLFFLSQVQERQKLRQKTPFYYTFSTHVEPLRGSLFLDLFKLLYAYNYPASCTGHLALFGIFTTDGHFFLFDKIGSFGFSFIDEFDNLFKRIFSFIRFIF